MGSPAIKKLSIQGLVWGDVYVRTYKLRVFSGEDRWSFEIVHAPGVGVCLCITLCFRALLRVGRRVFSLEHDIR